MPSRIAQLLLLALLSPVAPVAAQSTGHDVLAVEARADLKGRNAAAALLRSIRVDFRGKELTPADVCRRLALATGDKLAFATAARGVAAAVPPFELELKNVTLWSVLAVVEQATGLQFVYRAGVVFLVAKDEVRPLTFLVLYDLRPQCAPLKSFPGPKLGLLGPEGSETTFPPEEDSGTTVSGFTAELIEQLLKENVTPDLWAGDTVSLVNQNGLFLVRHTPQGHAEIARLLDELGLVPLPRVRAVRPPPPPRVVSPPKRSRR